MTRQLKKVICFFAPAEVSEQLRQAASEREVPLSQLLRQLVREFLMSQGRRESKHEKTTSTNEANASHPSSGFQRPDEKQSQIGGKNHE